jgi:hypothetical protein
MVRRTKVKPDPNYVFTLWVDSVKEREEFEVILTSELGLNQARNYLIPTTPSWEKGNSFYPMGLTLCVAAPNVYGLGADIVHGDVAIKKYLHSSSVRNKLASGLAREEESE